MGMISGAVTIASTGVAQSIAATMLPGLPTLSIGGVTYPAGSATQSPHQITLQNAPGNAATMYVGRKDMNTTTGVGVGGALTVGVSDNIGQFGGGVTLDDIWVIGTAGDKLLVQLVS